MRRSEHSADADIRNPYKGVRRRKWGKWVSEVRLPGSRDRLWLGSYSTPEAAAIAHDTAVFCLRWPDAVKSLNFPKNVNPAFLGMSPKSVKRVAAEAGMAIDAELMSKVLVQENGSRVQGSYESATQELNIWESDEEDFSQGYALNQLCHEELSISVDDMEICL